MDKVLNGMLSQRFLLLTAALMLGYAVSAQEGHPLKGSWLGEWASNEMHGENLLVILDWDGEQITGMINPGTDDIPIASGRLNPEDWTVTLEADAELDGGDSVHYVLEGTIEDLELPNRVIVGRWRRDDGGEGALTIRRQ